MKATVLDLRRRMQDVLRALDRNETVTLFYRGRKKALIVPAGKDTEDRGRVSEHPAFGMWKDRGDMEDVDKAVRAMRKGRSHAV